MIAEMHCHTSEFSSCSHVNAVELVRRAHGMGIQALIITDHHYQWNKNDIDEIKMKAGVPDHFILLSGEEFKTSDYGDILIYGLKETLKKQELSLKEVRKQNPDAAIIWAHPFRHNKIPDKDKLLNPLLDGIEIFSSNYTTAEAARALKYWHDLKFTAIAGTDTHALSYTGTYPTIFDHSFSTIDELVAEIKAGRCRPYFKEVPKAGTTTMKVTDITIGPRTAKERKKIIVKTFQDMESWRQGERSFNIINEFLNNGFDTGKYRVIQPLEKDKNNLSLIEERAEGESLYNKLLTADKEKSEKLLRLAGAWLAELHNLELKITPAEEYLSIERERLEYYISGLHESGHIHEGRVRQVLEEIWKNEEEIIKEHPEYLVQGHGDFHPKNIFVADYPDSDDYYAAAIDFNSSYQLLKAFDAGSFIAQHRNMFIDNPDVNFKAPVEFFYEEYRNKINNLNPGFDAQVELYKARTFLSIIYYLVKVGKGDSENFWAILVDAEKSLAHMTYLKEMI